MKILFSITYYRPYVSGLTLAASRWAEGLKEKGHHVSVLCMSGTGPGVVAAKPLFKISKGFLSWDWIVKSWQLVQKNDVIVINLPQFEGIIPALFAKCFRKKIIAIYHCEIVIPFIQWIMEMSHMMTLLLADEIVTYTQDYADSSKLLRLLKFLKKEIKIITPPIPKPKENKALTKQLQKKIGKADFVIGVAARLAREKGMEYLLAAIPQLKFQISNLKFKIVVAGLMEPVGELFYKQKIMKLVKKYRNRVVFLGEINPEHMGSFYRLIDVLVLPSINSTEAFGMVQVEAMLCGVPVVSSDLPGVRVPVQTTGMGRLVPPKDPQKLAEAITDVLRNRAQYLRPVEKYYLPEQSSYDLRSIVIYR